MPAASRRLRVRRKKAFTAPATARRIASSLPQRLSNSADCMSALSTSGLARSCKYGGSLLRSDRRASS